VYGLEAVLHALGERIQLQKTVDLYTKKTWGVPVGGFVEIMVVNKIMDPKAKVEIPDWYYQTVLPEFLNVEFLKKS